RFGAANERAANSRVRQRGGSVEGARRIADGVGAAGGDPDRVTGFQGAGNRDEAVLVAVHVVAVARGSGDDRRHAWFRLAFGEDERKPQLVRLIQAGELAAAQVQPVLALTVDDLARSQPADLRPDHAVIGYQVTSWLDEETRWSAAVAGRFEPLHALADGGEDLVQRWMQCSATLIQIAQRGQPSTQVDVRRRDAVGAEQLDGLRQQVEGVPPSSGAHLLRTDVNGQARRDQAEVPGRAQHPHRLGDG